MSMPTFNVTSHLDSPALTAGDGTHRGEILAANLVGAGNSALPNNPRIDNNAGQKYPVIRAVVIAHNGAHVTGTFRSTPSTTFTIEFFANATGDPSGYRQGQTYVTSISVTTDGGGNASFNNVPLGQIALGSAVSATATDNTSFNTSEFAQDAIATTTTATAVSSSSSTSTLGQIVTFTAAVTPSAGGGPSSGTVTFYDGTQVLGTGTLVSPVVWTFSTAGLPLGPNTITFTYSGNANIASSTTPASTQTVLAPSNTTVTPSTSTAVVGQSVILNATVTVPAGTGTPTGTVTFIDVTDPTNAVALASVPILANANLFIGGTVMGTATLDGNGKASMTVSSLPLGQSLDVLERAVRFARSAPARSGGSRRREERVCLRTRGANP
ncbi:MAG TPA: Ig-like domain-containing protein [Isosphaeraceae bacterium]|nr:Ig-like domain-containing protein [Isosphaeraceae bacterium]